MAIVVPHSRESAIQLCRQDLILGGLEGCVCYTTRVLLTIVSSVGGKCVYGVCVCVVEEGGQGPEQVVGLYLELKTKHFYRHCNNVL